MRRVLSAFLVATGALPIAAQSPAAPPSVLPNDVIPMVSGSGAADVKIAPDRATVRVGVETQAATAAAAASENATRLTAVLAALRRVGLPEAQLSTAGFNVSPQYRYVQNASPVLTGYQVTNTVVAELRDLSQVGRVLDAALQNGANTVSSLDFFSSNTDSARQAGIGQAVARARAEADQAARAAGGTLGPLLSLQIGGTGEIPPPRPMMARAGVAAQVLAAPTPINPGQTEVHVIVSGSWRFIPGR